jgi:hypothetical protein
MAWLPGLLVLGVATLVAAQGSPAVDTSGWTTLRDAVLGFELKHPPSWRASRSTGTLESVLLSGPAAPGAPAVSMQLLVQRGINPRGLSIEAWYADQLQRLRVTSPPPTIPVVVGGRPTIRRELSRPDGRQLDFYTAMRGTPDVFQVSVPRADAALEPTLAAVLSTLTFSK